MVECRAESRVHLVDTLHKAKACRQAKLQLAILARALIDMI